MPESKRKKAKDGARPSRAAAAAKRAPTRGPAGPGADPEVAAARAVLLDFFAAWTAWELRCAKWDREEEKATDAVDTAEEEQAIADTFRARRVGEADEIFARYCTPRNRHPDLGMSWGKPPEYDPKRKLKLDAGDRAGDRVTFNAPPSTGGYGFDFPQRFVLVRHGAGWLIDRRERLVGKTWRKDRL